MWKFGIGSKPPEQPKPVAKPVGRPKKAAVSCEVPEVPKKRERKKAAAVERAAVSEIDEQLNARMERIEALLRAGAPAAHQPEISAGSAAEATLENATSRAASSSSVAEVEVLKRELERKNEQLQRALMELKNNNKPQAPAQPKQPEIPVALLKRALEELQRTDESSKPSETPPQNVSAGEAEQTSAQAESGGLAEASGEGGETPQQPCFSRSGSDESWGGADSPWPSDKLSRMLQSLGSSPDETIAASPEMQAEIGRVMGAALGGANTKGGQSASSDAAGGS